MTVVRLAHSGSRATACGGLRKDQTPPLAHAPALLVSYVYLKEFLPNMAKYVYRDWVLDSGAFSAHNTGKKIDFAHFIETCHRLMEVDPTLTEIFALDVIGDWKASLRNCEKMWEAGIEAIPAFHPGEPWQALLEIAKTYPKIAIGGVVRWPQSRKKEFVGQVFACVWPKKIHGFGMVAEDLLMSFPFHSVDASSWDTGPRVYGRWKRFGLMSVRTRNGKSPNLRIEIEMYLALERKLKARWHKEMAILEECDG